MIYQTFIIKCGGYANPHQRSDQSLNEGIDRIPDGGMSLTLIIVEPFACFRPVHKHLSLST